MFQCLCTVLLILLLVLHTFYISVLQFKSGRVFEDDQG